MVTPQPENLRHQVSMFWVMEIRSGRANKQQKNKQLNLSFKERETSLAPVEYLYHMAEISLLINMLVPHKPSTSHRARIAEVSYLLVYLNCQPLFIMAELILSYH